MNSINHKPSNIAFNCHNPKGIKLLSRLRLGLSHLREHKFKHSFPDSLNHFCSCGKGGVETSFNNLLHCSNYSDERLALLNTIRNIDMSILQQFETVLLVRNVLVRSSHLRCSVKNGVLRIFVKFTVKHLLQRLFCNKVAGLKVCNFIKKSLWHRCFPVNLAKFLRTPFF